MAGLGTHSDEAEGAPAATPIAWRALSAEAQRLVEVEVGWR